MNVPLSPVVDETICFVADEALREELTAGASYIKRLAKVETLLIEAPPSTSGEKPKNAASKVVGAEGLGEVEVFVPLKGLIDVEAETKRLTKEISKIET